jgi:cytochrome P450
MTTRRPPGTMGLPLLGNTVPLVLNPLEFARRRTARYGLVWKTRFFNVPTVALIGAEAQRFVLQERHQNFSWKEGYSVGYDLFGDGLMWLDGPPHDEQRRAMQPAFHGQYLHDYLDRINRIGNYSGRVAASE